MNVKDLSFREAVAIGRNASVEDAAKVMKREQVGILIITNDQNRPVGVLTDRDIVLGVVAVEKPMSTKISEIMSKDVLHVAEKAGVADVIDKMEEREVRRAVVVGKDGRLCGLVSTDDLLQLLGDELNSLATSVVQQVSRKRTSGKA
ncbi:MAG: CBS domain-containing protein [Bdellovibrionota bacterium]